MDDLFSMTRVADPDSALPVKRIPDHGRALRRAQGMTSIRPPLSAPLDIAVEEPRI
jgi:hypothetical protein